MNSAHTIGSRVRGRGFTLIELMVVIAIIGIISAIAYPSYMEYVKKAKRADAQASLTELSQYMERWYTGHGFYSKAADGAAAPDLPFDTSPKEGEAIYSLSVSAISASGYTLEAAPIAGKQMAGDKCDSMTITNTGVRGVGENATVAKEECWKR